MLRFLWVTCFVLFPAFAAAQNQFGARLGLNAATVTGDFATSEVAEVRYGFVGGFYLAFPLRYAFTVQMEALYVQKGFRTDEAEVSMVATGPEGVTATFELTTLDVPLLVSYTVPLSGVASTDLYAGPYIGFELAEQVRIDADSSSRESNSFKGTDLGFMFGLDLTLALRTLQPSLGLRFSRSLSNQLERGASTSPDAVAYNSVVAFVLGLRL